MTAPRAGTCEPWATADDLTCLVDGELPGSCVGSTPVTQDQIDWAIGIAGYVVWALSGRQFGVCQSTIRPCGGGSPLADFGWIPFGTLGWGDFVTPVLYGGQWLNIPCGHVSGCSCTEVNEVALPAPVVEVVEVKLDGAVLDPAAYRVDDWRTLVRTDGARWPLCQDMAAEDTEDGTWSVTVRYGLEVPMAGTAAVAELACELLKARVGEPCRFPSRLTTLSRQGVTATFFDPAEFISEGRTGLYLVDFFLLSANPNKLRARPTVWSPDVPRLRVTGTGSGGS